MMVIEAIAERLKRGVITFIHGVILANWELPYDDSMTDTTAETVQSYQVGKNARLGGTTPRKFFVSKLTPIFCTTDTYVSFNSAEAQEHYLRDNTWYNFKVNIWSIHYRYVAAEGTIYAHFGGVLPNEARRAQ